MASVVAGAERIAWTVRLKRGYELGDREYKREPTMSMGIGDSLWPPVEMRILGGRSTGSAVAMAPTSPPI